MNTEKSLLEAQIQPSCLGAISGSIERLMKENAWYIMEYIDISSKFKKRQFLQEPKSKWIHCEVDNKTFDDLKGRGIITNVICDCQKNYYIYKWWLTDLSYYC